ncbi:hypothetical protein D840_02850 [Enterococcus faecalis 20.SD.W.06]|nr:hypothetical protein D840_02850 [Enterococcus faecalis 20.SD.W.06]
MFQHKVLISTQNRIKCHKNNTKVNKEAMKKLKFQLLHMLKN